MRPNVPPGGARRRPLETAHLSSEGPGPRLSAWRPVLALFVANVLFGAGLFAHAFLYNFYLQALGLGEGVMGLAAASLTAGGLVALVPSAAAVDRLGPRIAFGAAAALCALGLVVGALVRSPLAVDAAAFLAGMGAATWRVATGPLLLALAPPPIRSRAFSWNVALLVGSGSVWTAAAGAVPRWLEGWGTTPVWGIRGALLMGALATGVSALLVLALPATERMRTQSVFPAGVLASLAIPGRLMGLVGLVAIWMVGAAVVLPFFNLYFARVHDLPVERIGALFGGVQLITAGALILSGELAARVGPRRVLAAWVVLFAPALWGLAAVTTLGPALALYLFQNLVPPATNPLLDQLLLERGAGGARGGRLGVAERGNRGSWAGGGGRWRRASPDDGVCALVCGRGRARGSRGGAAGACVSSRRTDGGQRREPSRKIA